MRSFPSHCHFPLPPPALCYSFVFPLLHQPGCSACLLSCKRDKWIVFFFFFFFLCRWSTTLHADATSGKWRAMLRVRTFYDGWDCHTFPADCVVCVCVRGWVIGWDWIGLNWAKLSKSLFFPLPPSRRQAGVLSNCFRLFSIWLPLSPTCNLLILNLINILILILIIIIRNSIIVRAARRIASSSCAIVRGRQLVFWTSSPSPYLCPFPLHCPSVLGIACVLSFSQNCQSFAAAIKLHE